KFPGLARWMPRALELAHRHIEVEVQLVDHFLTRAPCRGERKPEPAPYALWQAVVRSRHRPPLRSERNWSCGLQDSIDGGGVARPECGLRGKLASALIGEAVVPGLPVAIRQPPLAHGPTASFQPVK